MRQLGVHNGADLKTWSERDLSQHFGKVGRHFFRIVRAIDDRPVEPERERKSVGIETTFHHDLTHEAEMGDALRSLAEKVCTRLEHLEMAAMTVTLKIKYQDFVQVTRSKTSAHYQRECAQILAVVNDLLHHPEVPSRPVRLLGVYLSNLDHETNGLPYQLLLPFDHSDPDRP
jgi:DNA polymerase-4